MAISLNDHESRIKSLENKILSTGSITKIATAVGTMSQAITNFDLVLLVSKEKSSDYWGHSHSFIIPKFYTLGQVINMGNPISGEANSGIQVKFTSTTNLSVVFSTYSTTIVGVYGLKLYYSFSYNIIYKILLRKISRLCQKFTLLKQKECEIIWL